MTPILIRLTLVRNAITSPERSLGHHHYMVRGEGQKGAGGRARLRVWKALADPHQQTSKHPLDGQPTGRSSAADDVQTHRRSADPCRTAWW